jgi:hypothetical protein
VVVVKLDAYCASKKSDMRSLRECTAGQVSELNSVNFL